MQTTQVEREVERIAARLGRGLSLEDLDGMLLAYSSHQSSADRVRVNFLLSKKVPADVSAWQLQHGIATAVRPVAVPANADLGMLGRVCVPLLVRGFRVGYLWVQQDSGEDTAAHILEQLPGVRADIDRLAALLLEDNTAGSEHRTRREAAFLAAAGGDRRALEECAGWPELDGTAPWHCQVLFDRPVPGRPAAVGDGTLARRTAALQATVGADAVVFSAGESTHSVLLVRHHAGQAELAVIRRRYGERLAAVTGAADVPLICGASEPFAAPEGLEGAYVQARAAVQAAAVDPQFGDAVEYRSIGAYQFLAGAGWQASSPRSVFFTELLEYDRSNELLPVLELLFDKNGSVQDVAQQLHLHRSSVYNRLARVRSVIGADPLSGAVRLELHLALKARRWSHRPRI
ncbi:Sugar diacid utilization regulator [Arthrobacter subterraneus]|uniref:Sugar diacid utilization regulator n=1 Tax=Arthrobacter subterraneus TaxID=335973 RepID=A0A1G8L4K2_9MICC|nr:PucR family transcriptional regulator [Arthrobacter subterraneus]SDI50624.1 Sugar diacid utilization regulator [Arthrobacter subterraneus]